MSKVTRMPNRSPKVTTSMTKGAAMSKPPKAANTNVSRTAREAAMRAKYPTGKGAKINSGSFAYGKKPSTPSMAGKIAKGIARGVGRLAGPAGALVSMTTPAGAGSDKPTGPLMKGVKSRGPGGLFGPNSGPSRPVGSRNAKVSGPIRSAAKNNGPSGPLGPNSGPSRPVGSRNAKVSGPIRSGGASNSKGPAGPSGPNSGPSRSAGTSKGPGGPLGPNSSPSRSTGTSKGPGGPLGPNSSPSRSGARTSFGGPR